MTRVLLVRHGEVDGSQLNAEGWWGPARDLSPLSARGIEQAKEAGRRLRDCGARRIVASPMTRAMQTARIQCRTPLSITYDSVTFAVSHAKSGGFTCVGVARFSG